VTLGARRRAAGVALLGVLAACSDITAGEGGVVALEVRPPVPPQVEVGDTIQLSARALDRNGDSIAAAITWRTVDPANVFIEPATGRVTGVTPGTIGRVQAVETTLASDIISLTVVAGADTVEVPDAPIVVDALTAISAPLAARVAARSDTAVSGFAGVPGRAMIYTIVDPVFADPAARTVEITGSGLTATVQSGPDGFPIAPVTLSRIAGQTAPATVLVEVSVARRSGALVPGSGRRFTVTFQ
jgi:hypothetical protein